MIKIFVTEAALPMSKIENIIIGQVMEAYDSASNGNRTRGGMKKANDMYACPT